MPRWLLLLLITLSILSPIKATASINSTTICVNDIPVFTSATAAVTSPVSPSPTPAVSADTTSNDALASFVSPGPTATVPPAVSADTTSNDAPASFVSPGPTSTVPPAVSADTTSNDAAPASFVSPGPTATASPSKTTYNSLAPISTISAPVPTASPRTSADSTTTDSDTPAHRSTASAATSVRQEAPPLSRTFDEQLQQPADPEPTENAVNDIDDDIANLLSGNDHFLNEPYRASFEWLSDSTRNQFPDNETAGPTSIFFTQKRRVGGVTFGPVLGYELELVVNRLHRTDQVEELCLPTHVAEDVQVQINTIHHAARQIERREHKLVENLQAAASDRARTKQLNEKLETALEGIAIETIKLQENQMLVANAFIVLLCMMAYLACQILRNQLRTFHDFEQPQDVASASTPVSPARRHVKQKMATAIQWMVGSFVSLIRLDKTHLVLKSAPKWLTSLHRPAFHRDTTASNKKRITSARTHRLVSYIKRLMTYVNRLVYYIHYIKRLVLYIHRLISLVYLVRSIAFICTSVKRLKRLPALRPWAPTRQGGAASSISATEAAAIPEPTSRNKKRKKPANKGQTSTITSPLPVFHVRRLISLVRLMVIKWVAKGLYNFLRLAYHYWKVVAGIRDSKPKPSSKGATSQIPISRKKAKRAKGLATSQISNAHPNVQATSTATQWLASYVERLVSFVHLDKCAFVIKMAVESLCKAFSIRPWSPIESHIASSDIAPTFVIKSARSDTAPSGDETSASISDSLIDTSADAACLPAADHHPSSKGWAAESERLSSDIVTASNEHPSNDNVTASEEHTDDSSDMEEQAPVMQSTSTDVIPTSTREHEIKSKSRSASPSPLSDDQGWTHVSSKKRTKKGLNHEGASNTEHLPPCDNTLDSSALPSGTRLDHSDLVPPNVLSALSEADFDRAMEGIRDQMGQFCETKKAAFGEELRVAVEATAAAKKAAKKAREKAKADASGTVS
ncbi:hypothetical protein QFC21_004582 [Naganishia friedmannii]|uniref:Uncharacterized protein n=1 Tax=Naganishia friedmannii TaxID=89922 RepID=A0ACC2VGS6_9TREE|nr:hypothetical protein QFC21_004582 [Naganishia friedmannii]